MECANCRTLTLIFIVGVFVIIARKALGRSKIELPAGQMTHSLRHTFASHFMSNGGNIVVLKEILGHSSLNDTMKYAHFAPTHLEEAIRLNPLATSRKEC